MKGVCLLARVAKHEIMAICLHNGEIKEEIEVGMEKWRIEDHSGGSVPGPLISSRHDGDSGARNNPTLPPPSGTAGNQAPTRACHPISSASHNRLNRPSAGDGGIF